MTLVPNSPIAVMQKQIHGNISTLETGTLISVQGNTATIMLERETIARDVPLDSISSADSLIGSMSGRPNEMAVLDLSPRR